MRIIDKYVLRSFLEPLFYCLFIFLFTYVIIDLFGHLDDIIKEHVGMRLLLLYYLAYSPSILIQVIPIAILISTMYTLGGLAKGNEITALRASGVGLWNILKPFLLTAALVFASILIINDAVVPKSTELYLKIKEEKIEKKKQQTVSNKLVRDIAFYGSGNKIIYARSYDPKTKTLKDIIIHEHDRHQNIISKVIAKEARWTNNQWLAFNITVYKVDREGEIKGAPQFTHRGPLNIKEGPEEFKKQNYKTDTLTISELRTYIKRLSGTSGSILQNLLVDAHNRIAYPFANIIAVLIGAAFCLKVRSSSRILGVGLGFVIGLLFYGTSAISTAMGKAGLLPPFIAAWLANIVFGLWGIYLINKY
ncbi:MAG: LptF/LptG family permease [Candidatus Omnitrophica bacterium]|nr:LptF/LptG family permease [Candidatus Omnitrophota bacterium]